MLLNIACQDAPGLGISSKVRDKRERVGCIFCGTSPADVYAHAKSLHDERWFTVVRCRQCNLVYTSPRIANKAAEIQNHEAPPSDTFEDHAIRRCAVAAEMQIVRLERCMRPGRLLDFGCGRGVLVHAACRRGWDAIGADIDSALIQEANAYWGQRRLFSNNVDVLIERFGATFDAIVATQVFEHLTNPLEFLVKMRSLLRPGGIVLVDVPNLRCLGERLHRGASLDPTAHLYYFTPQTIRTLFERAGFAILRCSGSPNMLGTYYEICSRIGLPRLSTTLAEITQRIPMPQIGSGLYVIGRMRHAERAARNAAMREHVV